MKWIYWSRLYDSKFQAGASFDGWSMIAGYSAVEVPQEIEVLPVPKKGKYGVRYLP